MWLTEKELKKRYIKNKGDEKTRKLAVRRRETLAASKVKVSNSERKSKQEQKQQNVW